ncbi:Uncharacterized protein TCM_025854 [Theobroma cacao]|uniref:Uncharacterized protein n=1 Tax=Theobroma cacao TaxID=3641 RepID=A0A061F0S4_THECC|nr:Uncharacterized protein TCM_025854 [Theobroma cacao]
MYSNINITLLLKLILKMVHLLNDLPFHHIFIYFGCEKKRQKQLACWEDTGGHVSSSRSSPPPSTAVHPCNVKLSLDWTPLSKTRDRERHMGDRGVAKRGMHQGTFQHQTNLFSTLLSLKTFRH